MINDKVIVGAMLVSQDSEMLDITIPSLMNQCDWALIVMDNETREVEDKVYAYQKKYYSKMFVRRSSIPSILISRKGSALEYRRRWKSTSALIRDDIFIGLRRILNEKKPGYDKIDILIWPDADVVFTDYLPDLLSSFLDSSYNAIMMRHVDVVGDMKTLRKSGMGRHVHIMKYSRELTAYPKRFFAVYIPLSRSDLLNVDYYSVHLAHLTEYSREWRNKNWKSMDLIGSDVWSADRDIRHMSPIEILEIFNRQPDKKFNK